MTALSIFFEKEREETIRMITIIVTIIKINDDVYFVVVQIQKGQFSPLQVLLTSADNLNDESE